MSGYNKKHRHMSLGKSNDENIDNHRYIGNLIL